MNILEYFALNEQPFRIGPDPRYLFYSSQVKEAIAKCEYMARQRVGPIYMYGPIGSGKTSILRRLTERLGSDKRYTVAYVIAANVRRPNTFLKIIMDAFDVESARSYDANLKLFEDFLVALASLRAPRRVPVGSHGYRWTLIYCNVIPAASISKTEEIRILVPLIVRSPPAIPGTDCKYFILLCIYHICGEEAISDCEVVARIYL
jgi:hypothetical protein